MFEKAKSIVALAEYCAANSSPTSACDQLARVSWFAVAVFVASIVLIGLVLLFRRTGRAKRSKVLWTEYLRQQDELAPELRMQHVAWKGDPFAVPEGDHAKLREQIRQGLLDRKINGR